MFNSPHLKRAGVGGSTTDYRWRLDFNSRPMDVEPTTLSARFKGSFALF
jgi:hypothetical protein